MAGNAFIVGILSIVSALIGATAWFANRAGRNSAKVASSNERAAANAKVVETQQAAAEVAARPITDDEYARRMMDGTA